MPNNITNKLYNCIILILAFIPISFSGGSTPSKKDLIVPMKLLVTQYTYDSLKASNIQKEQKIAEMLKDYELKYKSSEN